MQWKWNEVRSTLGTNKTSVSPVELSIGEELRHHVSAWRWDQLQVSCPVLIWMMVCLKPLPKESWKIPIFWKKTYVHFVIVHVHWSDLLELIKSRNYFVLILHLGHLSSSMTLMWITHCLFNSFCAGWIQTSCALKQQEKYMLQLEKEKEDLTL